MESETFFKFITFDSIVSRIDTIPHNKGYIIFYLLILNSILFHLHLKF